MTKFILERLGTDFERRLFAAVISNSSDPQNPLRANNFAYAMRELSRHVLHRLAPDKEVLNCTWYKNETQKDKGITRAQRAAYAIRGGLDKQYLEGTLEIDGAAIQLRLVKAINKLNKLTHVEEGSFNLPEQEFELLEKETIEAFEGFIRTIDICKKQVVDALWEHIDSSVVDEGLRETIGAIDELASHHYIDEIYTDKVLVTSVTSESVNFVATGSIGCELQWGSNSDIRKGDGAIIPESFKFRCELKSDIETPDQIEAVEETFVVDTKAWSEVRYGQDERA